MKKQISIKTRNRIIVICIVIALVMACAYMGVNAYISDYYHSNKQAVAITRLEPSENEGISINQISDDIIAFEPASSEIGFIFYPGGKVEYTAYAPLMNELAKNNITCILPHMTWNLAFMDMNAADELRGLYPDIKRWYIGGHSLGGVAAASYVAGHEDEYEGLILLASYSTKDLTDSGLNVITIYGSEDGVLNMSSYNGNSDHLPADSRQYVIEGGNHAYFGCYGVQDGDGKANITNDEQINTTVDFIVNGIGL